MTEPAPAPPNRYQSWWLWVLCLIGLDYFSTLGYQPSIAFQAAGRLAPLATVVVVLVTLLGALPVYFHVAAWSPRGQGSIGLLERLVPGWIGKVLILVLLAFAATNFIFTRTFSAADAAVHLLHNTNPHWQETLDTMSAAGHDARPLFDHPWWQKLADYWNKQLVTTLLLLLLSFLFWTFFRHGFTRWVIRLAVVVAGVYLLLNAVVLASGLVYLSGHGEILQTWLADVRDGRWHLQEPPVAGGGWLAAAGVCLLLFPKMVLGLSGFEMSMVVMPLVKGDAKDDPVHPVGRIRNTRKLLVAAAGIMSVYLLASALVTTMLIPPAALSPNGEATNRALAYLAHGSPLADGTQADRLNPIFGEAFGTAYDVSTILILCLAGASVTICLRDLVPPYLQRLGMELRWATAIGAILYVFNIIKVVVTVFFDADVGAQRGAYATSVLVLMASASAAGVIDHRRARRETGQGAPWAFALVTAVFLVTTLAIMVARPRGVQIAFWSILAILVLSMISRVIRTTELRFHGFEFIDAQSRFLWESLEYLEFPVLVPHHPGHYSLFVKEELIRRRHRLTRDVPVVFVEATLGDPSEFYHLPLLEVRQEDGRFTIRVTRCTSVAHAIAAVALELSKVGKPPEVHFGWSNENPFVANLNFVLFGQGNVPWMVRELIRKAEPRPERQPRIVIG
jgi:hypothetical protein